MQSMQAAIKKLTKTIEML